jgi:hypothetical protein
MPPDRLLTVHRALAPPNQSATVLQNGTANASRQSEINFAPKSLIKSEAHLHLFCHLSTSSRARSGELERTLYGRDEARRRRPTWPRLGTANVGDAHSGKLGDVLNAPKLCVIIRHGMLLDCAIGSRSAGQSWQCYTRVSKLLGTKSRGQENARVGTLPRDELPSRLTSPRREC